MKTCVKCKIGKEEIDFSSSELKKKSSWCKVCISIKNKKWARANPEKKKANSKKWAKANPEKKKAYDKKWTQLNPEKVKIINKKWAQANLEKKVVNNRKYYQNNTEKEKERSKKWKQENPEKCAANSKKWAQANPEKVFIKNKKWKKENPDYHKQWKKENSDRINDKQRDRYQNDPVYRNRKNTSSMVRNMLKSQGSSKKGESSINYFPWTSEEYELHIESLFEPWMNWSNQGVYNPKTHHLSEKRTWQLDHIIPQSDLPYPTMDHPNFNKTWNLSNLRPLDSKQNIIDGATRVRHKK